MHTHTPDVGATPPRYYLAIACLGVPSGVHTSAFLIIEMWIVLGGPLWGSLFSVSYHRNVERAWGPLWGARGAFH